MPKSNKPRAFTAEEVEKQFLTTVANYVEYWATLPNKTDREKVEGLAFSMLVILDGGSATLPGFAVTPTPHESDKDYHIERGENYFPTDVDIAGSLHEVIHRYFKK